MKGFVLILFLLFVVLSPTNFSQVKIPVGLWKFEETTNLTKAEIGNDLVLYGSHSVIDGPGKGAVRLSKGSYYFLKHNIKTQNESYFVNEYTLQIDFRVNSLSDWHCLFQTNPNNQNDGDCFINQNGNIGVYATGYSSYSISPKEWYRLIISVKNDFFYEYYLDGQPLYNGIVQQSHGRFSLEDAMLLFADNNGENGEIDCAEIAIWDCALNAEEVSSLGGYGHKIYFPQTSQLNLVPFLQASNANSIIINWHDPLNTISKVEYGTTNSLGESKIGASEIISDSYRWHTVKLENLLPSTQYYYRVISGSGTSLVYTFKTQPDNDYKGKIRFLLFSDTHDNDTTMVSKIIKDAKSKLIELYGNDFQNEVNYVLHCGDLVMSGNEISQWTKQFFTPMSPLSPYISFMTIPGNHEGENRNYYSYMKLDEFSGLNNELSERFWSFSIGNILVVGLNSNLLNISADKQLDWLKNQLSEAQNNSKIDFIFVLAHHMPVSELWGEGMRDNGSIYVYNQVLPILQQYSKVVQLSYGHTHGFERGTIESELKDNYGDFRIVCSGGGGGELDRWGKFKNQDYSNIHIAMDQYSYQLIEVDVANKTFSSKVFSLGNKTKSRNSELIDSWYKKVNQASPEKPITYYPEVNFSKIIFPTSEINSDSLMSVRIQISEREDFSNNILNSLVHWKNVFGVDYNQNPLDLNAGIDLTKLSFSRSLFDKDKTYFYRVRYRDHNLKWSEWSDPLSFKINETTDDDDLPFGVALKQNFPNPYNSTTKIIYKIQKRNFITLKVYDILGNEVSVLVNEFKEPGDYVADFDGSNLSSGVYFYVLRAGEYTRTRKLTLVR